MSTNSSRRRARTRDARTSQAANDTNYTRALDPAEQLQPGTVRIRLEAETTQDLDAHEAALLVLTHLSPGSKDYPNRRGAGVRRYLTSTGVRTPNSKPQSPLSAADDAKKRRDLVGEISALMAGDADLKRQPWLPLRPGDIVLTRLPADAVLDAYGTTYLAVEDETDADTGAMLRVVSESWVDDNEPNPPLTSFYELWFEWGPSEVVVIREGAIVHGVPSFAGR
jgi:hypothetical protein